MKIRGAKMIVLVLLMDGTATVALRQSHQFAILFVEIVRSLFLKFAMMEMMTT